MPQPNLFVDGYACLVCSKVNRVMDLGREINSTDHELTSSRVLRFRPIEMLLRSGLVCYLFCFSGIRCLMKANLVERVLELSNYNEVLLRLFRLDYFIRS